MLQLCVYFTYACLSLGDIMNEKEINIASNQTDPLVIYVNTVMRWKKIKPNVGYIMNYTIQFCIKHDLYDVFVACKLNPQALYAFARYKTENLPLKALKQCVDIINNGK